MLDAIRRSFDEASEAWQKSLRCAAVVLAVAVIVASARLAATALDTDAVPPAGELDVAVGVLPDGSPDPLALYLKSLPEEAQVNGAPLGASEVGEQLRTIAYIDQGRNPESIPALLPAVEPDSSVTPTQSPGTPLTYVPPTFPPGYQGLEPSTGRPEPVRPLPPYDPTGLTTDKQAVAAYIASIFPAEQVPNAIAIAKCESGIRSVVSKPNRNGSRDWGVFQLNDAGTLQGLLRVMGEDPQNFQRALDPEWNVRASYRLYQARGWQPWACAAKLGIVDGLWSYKPGPAARR